MSRAVPGTGLACRNRDGVDVSLKASPCDVLPTMLRGASVRHVMRRQLCRTMALDLAAIAIDRHVDARLRGKPTLRPMGLGAGKPMRLPAPFSVLARTSLPDKATDHRHTVLCGQVLFGACHMAFA
jgi:hypothetical protein